MSNDENGKAKVLLKRCPECFAYIALNVKRCPECSQRVGVANKFGIAKKPFNWKGYLIAFLAWTALFYFIWRAFLK